jgi:hypothetical protein
MMMAREMSCESCCQKMLQPTDMKMHRAKVVDDENWIVEKLPHCWTESQRPNRRPLLHQIEVSDDDDGQSWIEGFATN